MPFILQLATMSCALKGPYQPNLLPYQFGEGVRIENKAIKVMTLNIAHGRSNAVHQTFLSSKRIRQNLSAISLFIKAQKPDLVALQEADGPSFWSGRFDHVQLLTERSGYAYSIRGSHILSHTLDYGTAILSNVELFASHAAPFSPHPPIPTKGYVSTRIQYDSNRSVEIISVHLDFARKKVRKEQLKELRERLNRENIPLIIMGDFNMEWSSTLKELCAQLDLKAFRPQEDLTTFPRTGKRLDWILVSESITFLDYTIHRNGLSDHYAVTSTLILP